MLAVLAITATLVVTEPARTAYHPAVITNLQLGPDTVLVDAVPRGDRQMRLHLYLTNRRSRPVEPPQVTVAATLPASDGQPGIGPLPFRLVHDAPGHYSGTLDVPVTGRWQLAVTVRTSAIDEYTKSVPLTVR